MDQKQIVQQHASPDGVLTFIVYRDGDDVSLGFEGFAWHTHAAVLAALNNTSEQDAINQFVQDLLHDRAVIVISCIDEMIQDVWITEDFARELRHAPENETIEFRHWSGRVYKPA